MYFVRKYSPSVIRCYGNESNRSIAGMNDSITIARINFVLRASTTVRPSTGVTKTDTFWRLCTHSRDLNFCRINLGLGRILLFKTKLTDGSIKTGGSFHFFGPLSEKLPTVPVQSRKISNHVRKRVTCKLNSRPPEPRKVMRDSGGHS